MAVVLKDRGTVKVSSAGTLEIPKTILSTIAAGPGERFKVERDGFGLRLVPVLPAATMTVDQVAGCLYRPGREAKTDDEMNAALRTRARANDQATKSRR